MPIRKWFNHTSASTRQPFGIFSAVSSVPPPHHSLWARVLSKFNYLLARAFTFFRCSFQLSFSSRNRPNILWCLTISHPYLQTRSLQDSGSSSVHHLCFRFFSRYGESSFACPFHYFVCRSLLFVCSHSGCPSARI
jgi:hypothetical protein